MKNQPYLIVGTGRSGTSFVAKVLHEKMNIFIGENFPEKNETNPDGFFEDKDFNDLNKSFLYGSMTFKEWDNGIRDVLEERELMKRPWGFKDPRLSELLGLYLRYFDAPKIIRCKREKNIVIESLQRCYGFTKKVATEFWRSREISLDRLLKNVDHLEINFDKDKKTEQEVVDLITEKWGIEPYIPKQQSKRLSVCMIVKNEEACLERCLESVKDADEIIIVDTGSKDKTVEIAKRFTDKVYTDYKWNDNFAEARNHVKEKATGDWILSIDADEVLTPGGMEEIRKEIDGCENKAIGIRLEYADSGSWWFFPRLFRNKKSVKWKGAIHNYITAGRYDSSDIKILVYSSPAHKNDPNRALRILKREVRKNPKASREVYYLAREYIYRKDWIKALYWYERYFKLGGWSAERADAYLYMAKALWNLHRGDEARSACMEAIKINADFKEAIEFLAYISGEKNKDKWLQFAELAKNNNVLTNRNTKERDADYYNKRFSKSTDMTIWEEIYKKTSELVSGCVLDIGCGVASLSKYVYNYYGFDFSEVAVEKAKNKNVWVGNAYELNNYSGRKYDYYVLLEILEHVNDYMVLNNIPSGSNIVFSVPSFPDKAHLRFYTESSMRRRYENEVVIQEVIRFNFRNGRYKEGGEKTNEYILLVKGVKV